jgi:hypothetical protein
MQRVVQAAADYYKSVMEETIGTVDALVPI